MMGDSTTFREAIPIVLVLSTVGAIGIEPQAESTQPLTVVNPNSRDRVACVFLLSYTQFS